MRAVRMMGKRVGCGGHEYLRWDHPQHIICYTLLGINTCIVMQYHNDVIYVAAKPCFLSLGPAGCMSHGQPWYNERHINHVLRRRVHTAKQRPPWSRVIRVHLRVWPECCVTCYHSGPYSVRHFEKNKVRSHVRQLDFGNPFSIFP